MSTDTISGKIIDFIQLSSPGVGYLACGGTTPIYTKSAPLPPGVSFGVELQFSSPGTISVKVEIEEGNERCDTQAADTDKMAIPETNAGVSVGVIHTGISNAETHLINFSPMVASFARLKITGTGGNDAGTKITKARLVYVQTP